MSIPQTYSPNVVSFTSMAGISTVQLPPADSHFPALMIAARYANERGIGGGMTRISWTNSDPINTPDYVSVNGEITINWAGECPAINSATVMRFIGPVGVTWNVYRFNNFLQSPVFPPKEGALS